MTSVDMAAPAEQRSRRAGEVPAIRRGFPTPRFARRTIAVPTVLVWLGSFVAWSAATAAVLYGVGPWWLVVTIVVQGLVTFSMFTVLHESIHHTVGRPEWINQIFGRLSMPFVSLFGTFPVLAYIHIAHHRNTNEDFHDDPDAWSITGPRWQLPLRWLTIDAWYFRFYLARLRRQPRKYALGFAIQLVLAVALVTTILILGYGRELVLIYFIPQRIGMGILAWWFDWLPHHGLGGTAKTDRFRVARVRVGRERVLCLLLMYQNYHLVHHIHPAIPFYLYVKAWRAAEADYLDRNVPITTGWGQEMTPSEYRTWRSRRRTVGVDSGDRIAEIDG
ncbi:fatty acid desaturase [Mycobacterium sp. 852002-40037_SCH5390672]|uniref:fatty acid desaturase n=1 Tax=Mycobacterium sp. 852002-40037_SCH5390672 TaxID=1834089 RepID=UPI000B126B9E|nr:fatty acid desaturase [Mycobacterium sp. 852002-40037_SCH5390672]